MRRPIGAGCAQGSSSLSIILRRSLRPFRILGKQQLPPDTGQIIQEHEQICQICRRKPTPSPAESGSRSSPLRAARS